MAIFREKEEQSIPNHEHKPTTVIGLGITAEGDITGDGDMVIEGKVKGKITTTGRVRVGREAEVHADINASDIHIAGQVRGNVNAKEKVDLSETGKLLGNIKSKTVSISSGALFNGSCSMGEENQTHQTNKTK